MSVAKEWRNTCAPHRAVARPTRTRAVRARAPIENALHLLRIKPVRHRFVPPPSYPGNRGSKIDIDISTPTQKPQKRTQGCNHKPRIIEAVLVRASTHKGTEVSWRNLRGDDG